MPFDFEDLIPFALMAMVVAGFAAWIAIGIARQIAGQRLAENVLRERLARHWVLAAADGEREQAPAERS
jgi:hypothetical protein